MEIYFGFVKLLASFLCKVQKYRAILTLFLGILRNYYGITKLLKLSFCEEIIWFCYLISRKPKGKLLLFYLR